MGIIGYIQRKKANLSLEIFNVKIELWKVSYEIGKDSSDYKVLTEKLNNLLSEQILLNQISNCIEELVECYKHRGLQHKETIKVSQKLDKIINKYQKLKY